MVKIIDYLKNENVLGLGVVVGAVTFEMIEAVKKNTLDPLFEEIVDKAIFNFKIKFGSKSIDAGTVFYEIFRWYCYVSILFVMYELYLKGFFKTVEENVWTVVLPVGMVLFLETLSKKKSDE